MAVQKISVLFAAYVLNEPCVHNIFVEADDSVEISA